MRLGLLTRAARSPSFTCSYATGGASSRASAQVKDEKKSEEEEFSTGPLSVLTQSVKSNTQVLIK